MLADADLSFSLSSVPIRGYERAAFLREPSGLMPARPLGERAAELQALVDALNAAPDRIARGLTIADLQALGVPEDLLVVLRFAVAGGAMESEEVLAFLERVAATPVGDTLSKAAKRAIRSAGRRGGMLRRLGFGGKRP